MSETPGDEHPPVNSAGSADRRGAPAEGRPEPIVLRGFDERNAAEREAVLQICVLTGDAGADATRTLVGDDPDPLTERWAAPYLDLEPRFALLAQAAGRVVGYALGAPDTRRFAEQFRDRPTTLTPEERRQHALGLVIPEVDEYPAHLHVDLLPEAQGRGVGRRLVEGVVARLNAAGATGIHLVVDPRNTGALAFYPRVGFRELRRDEQGVLFVRA